ncbi:MAG TPA: ATP-grasp domain-containing protein [Burkholderiales bacterium]
MKIFAYEFITGGGLAREPLPASLAREGDLMARALARDLGDVPGVELWMSRDPRLPALGGARSLRPEPGEEPLAAYRRMVQECDAAWPVAPETGGMLEALSRITLESGKLLLGSRPEAVKVAASKRATAQRLASCGIAALPAYVEGEAWPDISGPWVVKPDDGAGSGDTFRWPDRARAADWLAARGPGFIAQPWVEGDALSLSALFADGDARLLAVNRQHLALTKGRVALEALTVNALTDADGRFARLAGSVAHALPGLWGYAGVDLVDTPGGPVVVEVNPRLTTSWCALREALGANPAALVLQLLESGRLPPLPAAPARAVEIPVEPAHA